MRVILDTNVLISGMFFSGPPYIILKAWRDNIIQLVVSHEILEEYQRVGDILGKQFPGIDPDPILYLIETEAEIVMAPHLSETVCEDPDDDKFLACALASNTRFIISGDKKLLEVCGYNGIMVVKPRKFVDEYLLKNTI